MILSFKDRFVEPILSGRKIHTFRLDLPNRWKEGNIIHFATGVRTKDYHVFKTAKCTGVQPCVVSTVPEKLFVNIDHRMLSVYELHEFAVNDGFWGIAEMIKFFKEMHGERLIGGTLIHWTDFRY